MADLPAKRQIPTVAKLHLLLNGELAAQKEQDTELNIMLNQIPPKSWLREHPTAKKEVVDAKGVKKKVPVEFLPIDKVEYLLTFLFGEWYFEIKECKQILNSIVVTGTLYYRDFYNYDTWNRQDGCGAAPIITKKDAKALDADSILASSVQIATPAAKSYAIKDAAECIGKIFGKDLNRSDEISYNSITDFYSIPIDELHKKLSKLLAECQDETTVTEIQDSILAVDENDTEKMREIINRSIAILEGHGR